jgi:hypothetical protein
MRITSFLSILFSLLFFHTYLFTQECEVLVKSLSEEYEGGCKKGLAHGEGKASGTELIKMKLYA